MARIEANNLYKKYKSNNVLCGLDFICEDEIMFLAGKNGSGKTTFIRIATGMERADSGCVKLLSGSKKLSNQKVGAVFDSPCLYHNMTGKENLDILCTGHFDDKKYSDKILECLKIDNRFLSMKAEKYSFGQKHRLSVAIALIRKPTILFLDEPTIGLDPESWDYVRNGIMLNRSEQKGCVVITGQDYFELGSIADSILILSEGKSKYYGSIDEFVNKFPKMVKLTTNTNILPKSLAVLSPSCNSCGDLLYNYTFNGVEPEKIFSLIKDCDIVIKNISVEETSLKDAVLYIQNQ
ncbi:MAG: ABC transporter ATP-binding protein [Acutalibacteraceae bacterium]|nr:ABC transporter ATP-binding protein [Acutalibacteraceae bacterium]